MLAVVSRYSVMKGPCLDVRCFALPFWGPFGLGPSNHCKVMGRNLFLFVALLPGTIKRHVAFPAAQTPHSFSTRRLLVAGLGRCGNVIIMYV